MINKDRIFFKWNQQKKDMFFTLMLESSNKSRTLRKLGLIHLKLHPKDWMKINAKVFRISKKSVSLGYVLRRYHGRTIV